ncbi:hypothetical protein BS50DRAFT_681413 [Corynespora cassiicola Philippines]|uniref:Uncharacterized protein n=1 Tax=Corynespora cassiicola Philippines TaxID=1448308 RepID=A0A2T2N759_CORCC|nr:hypothetical protein BS50DRAFT_681413 [Corynespora cassiicola Philippines]
MSTKKTFKNAVPVLAYADASAIDEPWLLGSLSFRHSATQNEISLLFATYLSVPGSDEEQNFVLVYDADNLVSGTTTLAPSADACDPAWLEKIVRDGVPRIRILSLTLRYACSVWCGRGEARGPVIPRPTPCRQLVEIAKASKVHMILDLSWLQKNYLTCLRRLTDDAKGLAGFPLLETLGRRFERADWTHFQPLDSDEPPAYPEASNKRSRRAISLTLSSPPSKRAMLDTAALPFAAGTPTEVATSPSCHASNESSQAIDEATTIDVLSNKSFLAEPSFEASPQPQFSSEQYVAISHVISQQLPHAFEAFVTRLFAHPDISPSIPTTSTTSTTSNASERNSGSPPPVRSPLDPLGKALVSHMLPHMKSYLQAVVDRTHDAGWLRREWADEEFYTNLHEVKDEAAMNIKIVKEEGVQELECARDKCVRDAEADLVNTASDFEDQLMGIYWDIVAKADVKMEEILNSLAVKVHVLQVFANSSPPQQGPGRNVSAVIPAYSGKISPQSTEGAVTYPE